MEMDESALHLADIDKILALRHHLSGDLWTTADKRLTKGGAFSSLSTALLLLELGYKPEALLMQELAELIFSCCRNDGRIRVSPDGAIYPCQTISAANVLSSMGYAHDDRLKQTFDYLLATQHEGGGWRCHKFSYGRGPETDHANPGPALTALNAFRHTEYLNQEPALDLTVEFLLGHWVTRKPLGPCHYGIGTLFMQVEYPFQTYNLFYYVYVLSHYDRAKKDKRFLEALSILESKLIDGMVMVERTNPRLADLSFCKKGKVSALASKRYLELKANLLE